MELGHDLTCEFADTGCYPDSGDYLLVGTEVDGVDHMQGAGCVMKNPEAKTMGGCGSSSSA